MKAATEAVDGDRDEPVGPPGLRAVVSGEDLAVEPSALPRPARPRSRSAAHPGLLSRRLSLDMRRELLWIASIYLAARGLVLIVAVLNDAFRHHGLQSQLAHWDGLWYRDVANHGYPHAVSHGQTNLGFFPLFPITIYLLAPALELLTTHNQTWAATFAGVIISGGGGLVATVFVHRLAEGWWDRATARRATVLFVLYPGAVVFSMVYSEGLLLPLATICIWALERRRWMIAGVTAGLGTAVQPVGLLFGVLCAVCALRELHRRGWRARSFRLSALATAMSASGAVAFMGFLWAWTGNPFANYIAQHRGWGEKTDPFALVHVVARQVPRFDPAHFDRPTIDLNDVIGLIGALLMLWELWLLFRARREVSLPAIIWSLGIMFFAFTSENVPPNPRLVITAFPMLMCIARRVRGPRLASVAWVFAIALAGLSLLTFTGHTLRP